MTEEYDGPDRRKAHAEVMEEVRMIIAKEFAQHEIREREGWRHYIDEFKAEAFPDGPIAHRESHQAMISAAKTEAEFWQSLKLEIAKKSIFGIAQILLILVAAGLAAKFGLGFSVFGK